MSTQKSALQIVPTASHHKSKQGYDPAVLDKSTSNRQAIRGRAQQMIEAHGGAKSQGGTSSNVINGVSEKNLKHKIYHNVALKEFGNE